jgi:hypothetical protein
MSNGLWFATIGILVKENMNVYLAVPFVIGAVAGNMSGAEVSMKIENLIGART